MPIQTPEQMGQTINTLLGRPNPLLFAGAGIGCRVGLPTWDELIEHLASTCDRFGDPESAVLVRKHLERRNHLGAATVFKASDLIPEGERWKAIAEPFLTTIANDTLDRLVPLVSLPFSSIVTTNFDHSLHDAYAQAHRRWVTPFERGQLRAASLSREFSVARPHGNVEQPTTMVLDSTDYRLLREDADYLDFLLNTLNTRSCLFLGFSFLDPAITHVLSLYSEKFGPTYRALHTAIIPQGDPAFASRLRQLNIQTIEYNSADNHADLWRGVRHAFESGRVAGTGEPQVRLDVTFGHAPIHRFVAFTYAQARLRSDTNSIAIIAQDGIVACLLSTHSDPTVAEDLLEGEVASALRLSTEQARQVVRSSLTRLEARDQILRDGPTVVWVGATAPELDQQLTTLARDVLDRMRVRSGAQPTDRDLRAAKVVVERILMSRAWDISAHFAGGNSGWSATVGDLIADALHGLPPADSSSAPEALAAAVRALLKAPDAQEAELLTTLGRAAFGIQLLLASPRQTLFHKYALPRTLYLDANVLMPAITAGHPQRPAYMEVIERLAQAARQANVPLTLAVGYQFLNEIVSHRRIAIDTVEIAGLENPEKLRRHIQFYSAENTNVFVGAYGTAVGRRHTAVSFSEFLRKIAPYSNEDELATYLERLGIHTVSMDFRREHNSEFEKILSPLKQAYEDLDLAKAKTSQLVHHEAQQLTQLVVDANGTDSSLFVTADRKLRRALSSHVALRHLSGMTVSHLGLVALADVMVGISGDARSLARLVWAAPAGDHEKTLFDYFVNLGLREYHEGLAAELQQLASHSAEEANRAAEAEHIKVFSHEAQDIAKTADFLDRFEDRFYQSWRKAIERRERNG